MTSSRIRGSSSPGRSKSTPSSRLGYGGGSSNKSSGGSSGGSGGSSGGTSSRISDFSSTTKATVAAPVSMARPPEPPTLKPTISRDPRYSTSDRVSGTINLGMSSGGIKRLPVTQTPGQSTITPRESSNLMSEAPKNTLYSKAKGAVFNFFGGVKEGFSLEASPQTATQGRVTPVTSRETGQLVGNVGAIATAGNFGTYALRNIGLGAKAVSGTKAYQKVSQVASGAAKTPAGQFVIGSAKNIGVTLGIAKGVPGLENVYSSQQIKDIRSNVQYQEARRIAQETRKQAATGSGPGFDFFDMGRISAGGLLYELPAGPQITDKYVTGNTYEKTLRKEMKERGFNQEQINIAVKSGVRQDMAQGRGEFLGLLGSSTVTELTGRKIFSMMLSKKLLKTNSKKLLSDTYKRTFIPFFGLGAVEGGVQEYTQATGRGESATAQRVAIAAGIGGVSGGLLGPPIMTIPAAEKAAGRKALNFFANILDPLEKPGDITADIFTAGQRRIAAKFPGIITPTPEPIIQMPASTRTETITFGGPTTTKAEASPPGRVRSPAVPSLIPVITPDTTITPIIPTDPRKSSKSFVPSPVPTPITPPSITTPTPINIPPIIPTDTTTPVTTNTPINIPLFAPIVTPQPRFLPPIPPMLPPDFGGGSGAGTRRGKRTKFYDELTYGLSLIPKKGYFDQMLRASPKPKKKASKKKKKRNNRFVERPFFVPFGGFSL
jgi:hypothetical protein